MYRRASSDGLVHHKRTVRSQSPEPFSLQEVMVKLSLTSPAAIGGAITPEKPTRPQASDGDGAQWRERANQVKQMTQLHLLLRQWFELPNVEQHARVKLAKEQQFGFELLCSKMQRAKYDIIKCSRTTFVAHRMALIRKSVGSPRRVPQTAPTPQKPSLQLNEGPTTPRGRTSNRQRSGSASPDDSYFAADSPQATNQWQSLRSSSSFTAQTPPGEATMVPLGRQYRKSLSGGEQLQSS